MAKVETSVVVNRPVAEVFQFMSINENALQWQSGLLETRITNDVIGPGRAWIDTTSPGPALGNSLPDDSRLAAQPEDCVSEHRRADPHAGQFFLRAERGGRAGDFSADG